VENEVVEVFDGALARLERYVGAEDAAFVVGQTLRLCRLLSSPTTADELYQFAVVLVEGPFGDNRIESLGRALKVKALLLGALAPVRR